MTQLCGKANPGHEKAEATCVSLYCDIWSGNESGAEYKVRRADVAASEACGPLKMAGNQFNEAKFNSSAVFYCSTFPFVILGRREKENYLKRKKQNKAKSQSLVS